MANGLVSGLNEVWSRFVGAATIKECDRRGQEFWLLLVRQARGSPQQRYGIVAPTLAQGLASGSLRAVLPLAAEGVYAWYESDFRRASRKFRNLDATLRSRKRLQEHLRPDCGRILRLHALCWTAAALVRLGQLKAGGRCLGAACRLLDKATPRPPNAEGWYWAESGRAAFYRHDVDAAERHCARAYECFQAADNEYGLGEVACAQARLLTHQGRYQAALERMALAQRWRDHDNDLERAKACFHTGRILRYQHKYPEALDAFKSGLVYVRESRSAHWEANLHDALGDVYLLQNQLDEARREYRDFLACDPKGPGLRDRAKYQQAKLALSEAMAEPPGPGQQQMLHKVRKACAELAHGPGFEMLPSKARLIESQALMAGRNFPLAAEVSQKAAQSFREHSAWWYAAEAMLSTGEAYLAAGEMAQAARVFLAGLQSTVDDLQRQRFLDQIRLKSSMLDPQEVCACLAELLDQNRQLADARDACRRTEDGLRNLMRTMKFPLAVGVGSVAHLQDVAIQLAEQFPKNQCALKAVEETRAHAELLECQVQLAECWQTRLCTPRWISFAEIVGAASPPLPKVQVSRLARRRHLGIFADPELVAHALGDCAEMVRQWVGLARASCAYVEAEQHLVVRFFGTPRAWQPVSSKLNELIQEVPPPATLRSCRLKPQCWARLNWAAIRLRSIGGTVRFSLEARASDRPQRNCCLEVRLPCDEVPLWHADFNPNPVKEA